MYFFMMVEGRICLMVNSCTQMESYSTCMVVVAHHHHTGAGGGGSTVCCWTGLRTGGLLVQAPGTPPPTTRTPPDHYRGTPEQRTKPTNAHIGPSDELTTHLGVDPVFAHVQPPHPRNPQRHKAVMKTKHLYLHTQYWTVWFCNCGYFARILTPPPSTFSIWGTPSQLALVMTSSAESSTYKRRKCLFFWQQPRL